MWLSKKTAEIDSDILFYDFWIDAWQEFVMYKNLEEKQVQSCNKTVAITVVSARRLWSSIFVVAVEEHT